MSSIQDPVARKKALIEAAKARSALDKGAIQQIPTKKIEFISPENATNKIRIVVDNSGSMSTNVLDKDKKESTSMEEAKKGIVEFLRNCVPNKDAVAIHLLNNNTRYSYDYDNSNLLPNLISNSTLETDLVAIASAVDDPSIAPTGGTPLLERLNDALDASPTCSRIVAFSDGEAFGDKNQVCEKARAKKIPIDTVYIGEKGEDGHLLMQYLAEHTGGICLVFDPAKGVNFAEAFKYLTPQKRLMLMNEEFKAKLERGEIK